jgi:hypothetical protein
LPISEWTEVWLGIGQQIMSHATLRVALTAAIVLASVSVATALLPLARPERYLAFVPGHSAPFAGSWAITMPTMDVGERDEVLARCDLPVRIRPADERHIFYLGLRETEPEAAIELQATGGGAVWAPIAGGPSFFAFWVSQDIFYLYDEVPLEEVDWGRPYVYRRCLSE